MVKEPSFSLSANDREAGGRAAEKEGHPRIIEAGYGWLPPLFLVLVSDPFSAPLEQRWAPLWYNRAANQCDSHSFQSHHCREPLCCAAPSPWLFASADPAARPCLQMDLKKYKVHVPLNFWRYFVFEPGLHKYVLSLELFSYILYCSETR